MNYNYKRDICNGNDNNCSYSDDRSDTANNGCSDTYSNNCCNDVSGKAEVQNGIDETVSQRSRLIWETGEAFLNGNSDEHHIHLLTIIGEIEGHDLAGSQVKTTKYEHLLPRLAMIENDESTDGLLLLLNTTGGDVDAGLSIAEMIASLSKPSVSLVLGGSHSIGVPLAVSTTWSFIVPTGTMIIHPVQMSGRVIGAPQTYEYNKRIQDRITGFIAEHSNISQKQLENMMMENTKLTRDLGTLLIGKEAVQAGVIREIGGIQEALTKLHELIAQQG
ncbi:MAG: ATP-dependent Clp protease proteolytic subunit [Lachnospiraceae bacterium]|nr:ATP-dependent Clp protease proteolytic subunit [Lachnospiraceae bacterium]